MKKTLGRKILFSFLFIILIYATMAIISNYRIDQIRVLAEDIVPHSDQIIPLQELSIFIEELEMYIDKLFVVGYAEYEVQIDNKFYSIYETLNLLGLDMHDESRIILDDLETAINKLNENVGSIIGYKKSMVSELKQYDYDPDLPQDNVQEINQKMILMYKQLGDAKNYHHQLVNYNAKLISEAVDNEKAQILAIKKQLFTLGLLILICGLLLSFYLTKSISHPINNLKDATVEIGLGKLSTKIGVESNDEIGQLAESFNQMVDDLKRSRKEMKDSNKKLEEKTKELHSKNMELERFNNMVTGRELKMVELKKKIADLERKIKRK